MAHVRVEKAKLLQQLRRIGCQLAAVEQALAEDAACAGVLQQATSCRAAMDGFIAGVVEDHILEHMVDQSAPIGDPRVRAAEELVTIIHTYLS